MKKLFIFSAAASLFFASCSNPNKGLEVKKDIVVTDTSKMYNNNISTDVAKSEEVAQPQAEVRTITKIVYVDRSPKPVKHKTVREATAVQTQPVTNVPTGNTQGNSNTQTSTDNGAGTTAGTTNDGSNTSPTATPVKKKGWSNAAKDATIGGVGGAVTGAIFSKNKVVGAVIGGVIGAAGGYIFGSQKDKREVADK